MVKCYRDHKIFWLSIIFVYRQFLGFGYIHKFNRLVQIDDTGVRTETLDN